MRSAPARSSCAAARTSTSRASRTHPVVRVHPETGLKCLFVNPFFTSHIVGFSSAESAALLNFLYAHMQRPEFAVRWHWTEGEVALWDNRCTMHTAVDDYGNAARIAQRVCIRGDKPVGVAGLPVLEAEAMPA
jgi:taurine dioxygenase